MLFAEHITDHEAAITSSCISSLNRRKQLPQAIIRIDQGNEILIMDSLPFDSDHEELNNSYLSSLNDSKIYLQNNIKCESASSIFDEHTFIMNAIEVSCPSLGNDIGRLEANGQHFEVSDECIKEVFGFPGNEVNVTSEFTAPSEVELCKQLDRKEKYRLKKREQRTNPAFKAREQERERKRMRQRRLDPSFRDNERKSEAKRKRDTRLSKKRKKELTCFDDIDLNLNFSEENIGSTVTLLE